MAFILITIYFINFDLDREIRSATHYVILRGLYTFATNMFILKAPLIYPRNEETIHHTQVVCQREFIKCREALRSIYQ